MGGVVRAIAGVGLFALGVFTPVKIFAVFGALATAQGLSQALSKPRSNLAPFDPKSVNVDPATPRKLALGRTTFAMDVRYSEPSGTNQEFVDYIVAFAAHKSDAIESIYIEDDLAWTVGGGAQGKYAGYLTVEVILEAGPSAFHTVNSGATWGSTRRLTGCTTAKIRVKRSDNSKSSLSPFASGIGGRWTVIGRGLPVYDPALDSTVPGGSGSQRATDQSTWAYTATIARGNNPALQLLAYLLGWRIGGVVSVGVGIAPDLIDLPSFAAAAALCDESVALAAGGTQRRFEAGRTFTDADDPLAVIAELLKAMNGELNDDGGRLSLRIAVNDLTPAVTLTDDDFVSGYSWQPQPSPAEQYTVVRGRYTQPDAPALFNLADFPEVAIPRVSNVPRPLTLELTCVQEQRRAQRIAKQAAQRSLYQGTLTVTLGIRGWLLRRNMVVAITSNARAWSAKLFRVRGLTFNEDGTVEAVFREENAAIYAWDASESPVVTPVAPIVFDPRNAASWLMAAIEPGATNTAPTDANRVPFSLMEGDDGWQVRFNSSLLANTAGYGTQDGYRYFGGPFTATAAGQVISIGTKDAGDRLFPVSGGERLSVQARIGFTGAAANNWSFDMYCKLVDGSFVEVPIADGSGPVTLAGNLVQAFINAPANAVGAYLELFADSSGAGSMDIRLARPMVTGATDSQTEHPAFNAGPNSRDGADATRATVPAMPRGLWQSGVAYGVGDFVFDANSTWSAIVAHTSSAGNRPGLDASIWSLIVAAPDTANLGTTNSTIFFTGTLFGTSYGSPAGSFSVRAGAGGIVDLSISSAAELELGTSAGTAAKFQRWTGSTWVDVGTEMTGPTATDTIPTPAFNDARQATGLTNGTSYDFRVLGRRTGGSAGSEVSISGIFTAAGR